MKLPANEVNNAKVAIFITLLLTAVVAYKRSFKLNLHDFELTFGRTLLNPRLRIFSVLSALILMLPLNSKIVTKAYREVSGYYVEMQKREKYMRSLRESPIKTLALEDPETTTKYLGLPLWLSKYLTVFSHKAAYVFAGSSCAILILTSILLWKIIH